jgi:hypothetical protein
MPDVEDGGGNNTQKEQQWEALGFIRVVSFTANPPSVPPFANTTISWQLQIPTNINFPLQFLVNGDTFHGNQGSTNVQVVENGQFGLTAKTPLVERVIGSVTVNVDASTCVSETIDPTTFGNVVKGQIEAAFPASNQFSFRGDGPVVTPGNGTVTVDIPLNIDVPDWFDAEADFTVQLNVGPTGSQTGLKIDVALANVNVDINWSLFGEILSLGCEHFIETAMQKVAEAFVTQIVVTQSIPNCKDALDNLVGNTAAAAKVSDPQHRDFVLTSFVLTADGLSYTVCPKPKPSSGGSGGTLPSHEIIIRR